MLKILVKKAMLPCYQWDFIAERGHPSQLHNVVSLYKHGGGRAQRGPAGAGVQGGPMGALGWLLQTRRGPDELELQHLLVTNCIGIQRNRKLVSLKKRSKSTFQPTKDPIGGYIGPFWDHFGDH